MIDIPHACNCVLGPYKTYLGNADYDGEANVFHGEVTGTRDVITFQGQTMPALVVAFKESVDDYLRFCEERGEPAEKPFSGKFVARINPEIHRQISMLARAEGKSLNQFVCDRLQSIAETAGSTVPQATRAQKRVRAKSGSKGNRSIRTWSRNARVKAAKSTDGGRRPTSRIKRHP